MTKAELEARRLELFKHSGNAWLDSDMSTAIKAATVRGFDLAAALLQGEIDSANKLADKNAEACELLSQEIDRLRNHLQSANAKLAAIKTALEFYANPKTYDGMTCESPGPLFVDRYGDDAREALAQIAAMDASEGKGKE